MVCIKECHFAILGDFFTPLTPGKFKPELPNVSLFIVHTIALFCFWQVSEKYDRGIKINGAKIAVLAIFGVF